MLTEKAVRELRTLLRKNQIITNREELVVYELDAAQDRGIPDGVVLPRTVEEIQRVVEWARENKVALIGRGAGTGLSGGAVPERGGVIVEFSRMNRILEIDTTGRSAVAEPGVINLALEDAVRAFDLYYPPDPASGRTATLGGNVAENAGGPHCFKYGVTTNYVTGLECVAGAGGLIQFGGQAYDYPEYDFVRLLTGSEGTLGLITKISVRLLHNPPAVKTLMAAFHSVAQAGMAVTAVIGAGLVPATIEMMDQKMTRIIEEYAHAGLLVEAGAQVIIDVDGYPASLDPQIEEVVEILRQNGGYDLRISNTAEEREKIWYGRKSAAGALARLAPASLLLDGCVPRSLLAEILDATNQICEDYGLQVGYVLHAGDGNLHPYILMYPEDAEQVHRVHQAGEAYMRKVVSLGGSITGEHGVGIEKRAYMPFMFNPTELGAMLQVKQVFDPDNLMNPGKVFPEVEPGDFRRKAEGQAATNLLSPASVDEAAEVLAAYTQARQPIAIRGSGGSIYRTGEKLGWLTTAGLNRIHKFTPQDLYVTVGSGITLDDLQRHLKQEGTWIPIASPWESATLGGLMAANVNAPLRMRYGSLSDQVLAMTVVLADGRILRAGRPVVKNCAGYDLVKVFVGSFGSLGLMADITCKVTALPRMRRSLFVPVEDVKQGLELGQMCVGQALVASAVVLTKGIPLPGPAGGDAAAPYWLTYTAEGLPQDVEAETGLVQKSLGTLGALAAVVVEDVSGTQLWQALLGGGHGWSTKVRVGVPAKELANYLKLQKEALERGDYLFDLASGLVYASVELDDLEDARLWIKGLRECAQKLGGYLFVVEMPNEWQGMIDRADIRSDVLEVMRALKARWDPAGILSIQKAY